MRVALLLLAAAVAAPAASESIVPDEYWVGPTSTEYDLVEEVDLILLVRAVETRGEEVRFKLEEALKGEIGKETGRTIWLQARSDARPGARHLVFLTPNGDGWDHSDLGFIEIRAEDEDWVRVLRLFSGIAALDDEELETKALRELREAALADPERYPAKLLVRMIDQHFGTPTPDKPFSDLLDLYDAAATDGERLAVLWALRHGEHPETAGLFRSLLLGGEPMWLMRPVLEWLGESDGDLPLLKDLARVWLGHPREERGRLLELILDNAEPEDARLLWSLLPAASLAEKVTLLDHVLERTGPDPVVDGLRLPSDERLKSDLLAIWMSRGTYDGARVRLGELLRQDQAHDWRSAASFEELIAAFETSRDPAERRQVLMEVDRRLDEGDDEDREVAVLWWLLRKASPREAEALLNLVYYLISDEEKLAALYRAAPEEEKNRALWFLLAAQGDDEVEPLLTATGVLGQGSVRLERVARAFLTCPNEDVRLQVAGHLEEGLATAGDFLTMLKVLEGASLAEARVLAPWFARHPGPEALSHLWRLPIPSLHEDAALAEALAAAGDPEVLDMALDLRRRVKTEDDAWAYAILARSPLPAAQEEALAILEEGGFARSLLMWEIGEEDNASPWREWFLRRIAESESVDEPTRNNALTYLARLSEPEEP